MVETLKPTKMLKEILITLKYFHSSFYHLSLLFSTKVGAKQIVYFEIYVYITRNECNVKIKY